MSRVEAVDEAPGFGARLLRRLLVMLYRRGGWTSVGTVPEPQRFVLIAVPHTSNWDFPNFLGVTHALGIRTHTLLYGAAILALAVLLCGQAWLLLRRPRRL